MTIARLTGAVTGATLLLPCRNWPTFHREQVYAGIDVNHATRVNLRIGRVKASTFSIALAGRRNALFTPLFHRDA